MFRLAGHGQCVEECLQDVVRVLFRRSEELFHVGCFFRFPTGFVVHNPQMRQPFYVDYVKPVDVAAQCDGERFSAVADGDRHFGRHFRGFYFEGRYVHVVPQEVFQVAFNDFFNNDIGRLSFFGKGAAYVFQQCHVAVFLQKRG